MPLGAPSFFGATGATLADAGPGVGPRLLDLAGCALQRTDPLALARYRLQGVRARVGALERDDCLATREAVPGTVYLAV